MKQQMVSRLIVLFTYLFIWYRLLLSGTSLIFPIIFSWFPIFSTRKDSVKVLCWEKVTPGPFDHVVLSCCLPGKSIFCESLWCCEFSFHLAFISLCRRKRRFKKKCFVLSFHCPTTFIFFTQSDGDCVTLFTLAITIKESLAGGNASCSVFNVSWFLCLVFLLITLATGHTFYSESTTRW